MPPNTALHLRHRKGRPRLYQSRRRRASWDPQPGHRLIIVLPNTSLQLRHRRACRRRYQSRLVLALRLLQWGHCRSTTGADECCVAGACFGGDGVCVVAASGAEACFDGTPAPSGATCQVGGAWGAAAPLGWATCTSPVGAGSGFWERMIAQASAVGRPI